MALFWRRLPAACLALAVGCAGRVVQGVWEGPLPLISDQACRIRLMRGGRFDFTCSGARRSAGLGQYRFAGKRLSLRIETLSVDGEMARPPDEFDFEISGPGNEMNLRLPTGEAIHWSRKPE